MTFLGVYVDVLLTTNFIINILALKITYRLYPIHTTNKKIYLAAFLGAIFTLSIFIPNTTGILQGLVIRLVATSTMVLVGFGRGSPAVFVRLSVILMIVGIVFAGVALGVNYLLLDTFFTFTSGAIYLRTPPILLLGCILLAYILLSVFDKIYSGGVRSQNIQRVRIHRAGSFVEVQCFVDTGSSLNESFSGLPVMLIELDTVKKLLTNHEYTAILNDTMPNSRFRPVFFRSAGGNGIVYAFKPDSIYCGDTALTGYVAVTKVRLDCAGSSALAGLKFFTALQR